MTLLGYRNPVRRVSNAVRLLVRRSPPPRSERRCFAVGHRGAPRFEAENTIPSFAKAIALGADAVETDVCVTADGHFVLWHDARPDDKLSLVRQADAEKTYLYEPDVPKIGSSWRRPVQELTLEELRAHHGYVPREGNEDPQKRVGIALLDDFFAWSKTEPRLDFLCLDLKLGEDQADGARQLAAFVRERRRSGKIRDGLTVAMFCPHEETLQAVLSESRIEPLGKDVWIFGDFELPGAPEVAHRFGVECVSFGVRRRVWRLLWQELEEVLAGRETGRTDKVFVWTVNEEKRLRELVDLGVDGILTDDPALLRRIVGRT